MIIYSMVVTLGSMSFGFTRNMGGSLYGVGAKQSTIMNECPYLGVLESPVNFSEEPSMKTDRVVRILFGVPTAVSRSKNLTNHSRVWQVNFDFTSRHLNCVVMSSQRSLTGICLETSSLARLKTL